MGDNLTRNRYVYVKNNPYKYVDPSGNKAYPFGHPQSLGNPDDFRYFFNDQFSFQCVSSNVGNICALPSDLKPILSGSIIGNLTVDNLKNYNFEEMRPATFGENVVNKINIAGQTYDYASAYGRYKIFNMFEGFRELGLSYEEYYSYFDAPMRNQFASNLRAISTNGKNFLNKAAFVESSGIDDTIISVVGDIMASPIDSIANVSDPYMDTYNKLDDYAGLTVGGLLAAKGAKSTLAAGATSRSINNVDDLIKNPKLLEGKSLKEVQDIIGSNPPGWKVSPLNNGRSQGSGWTINQWNSRGTDVTDLYIQYSPGSTRHFNGSPYWKVSSGSGGTQRFIAK